MDNPMRGEVLLGTVAIEPNRWRTVRADGAASVDLRDHLAAIARLPIDGIEVWERHVTDLPPAAFDEVVGGPVPVRVFNSYVDFDDPDDAARDRIADHVARSGARAVKFNVGNDPDAEADYLERLIRWLDRLPDHVAAICECHQGISIAEDPVVAARILTRAGPPERAQALVHTHDSLELIAAKLDALDERITHVHVNHLDFTTMRHPPLAEVTEHLGAVVGALRSAGFAGSWTLEFVAGLLTEDDHPDALLAQAAVDLPLLRRLVETP